MKSILVVEDEFDFRAALALLLKIEGYEVVEAWNGHLALEVLRNRKVDLIVTDWMMPMMGGEQFLQQRRTEGLADGVPIVLMSSLVSGIDLDFPEVRYLSDKSDVEALLGKIRELLSDT